MARLLSPPAGVYTTSIEPLSGPRTVGSSQGTSIGNFTQSVASPFAAWQWRFSFPPMRGPLFRRYRGWVTALHGGANATRWTFFDPDAMSYREAGLSVSASEIAAGKPWSNGRPWSNKKNWRLSKPVVPVVAPSPIDSTFIELGNQMWGHKLDIGDYLGFFPFYFGLHVVTEVDQPGSYRIWPPLRKSITSADFATLSPTLAMRMMSEESAPVGRGLSVADGLEITLVEVFDYDVRDYFDE